MEIVIIMQNAIMSITESRQSNGRLNLKITYQSSISTTSSMLDVI
jgi:hypothetical protein